MQLCRWAPTTQAASLVLATFDWITSTSRHWNSSSHTMESQTIQAASEDRPATQ